MRQNLPDEGYRKLHLSPASAMKGVRNKLSFNLSRRPKDASPGDPTAARSSTRPSQPGATKLPGPKESRIYTGPDRERIKKTPKPDTTTGPRQTPRLKTDNITDDDKKLKSTTGRLKPDVAGSYKKEITEAQGAGRRSAGSSGASGLGINICKQDAPDEAWREEKRSELVIAEEAEECNPPAETRRQSPSSGQEKDNSFGIKQAISYLHRKIDSSVSDNLKPTAPFSENKNNEPDKQLTPDSDTSHNPELDLSTGREGVYFNNRALNKGVTEEQSNDYRYEPVVYHHKTNDRDSSDVVAEDRPLKTQHFQDESPYSTEQILQLKSDREDAEVQVRASEKPVGSTEGGYYVSYVSDEDSLDYISRDKDISPYDEPGSENKKNTQSQPPFERPGGFLGEHFPENNEHPTISTPKEPPTCLDNQYPGNKKYDATSTPNEPLSHPDNQYQIYDDTSTLNKPFTHSDNQYPGNQVHDATSTLNEPIICLDSQYPKNQKNNDASTIKEPFTHLDSQYPENQIYDDTSTLNEPFTHPDNQYPENQKYDDASTLKETFTYLDSQYPGNQKYDATSTLDRYDTSQVDQHDFRGSTEETNEASTRFLCSTPPEGTNGMFTRNEYYPFSDSEYTGHLGTQHGYGTSPEGTEMTNTQYIYERDMGTRCPYMPFSESQYPENDTLYGYSTSPEGTHYEDAQFRYGTFQEGTHGLGTQQKRSAFTGDQYPTNVNYNHERDIGTQYVYGTSPDDYMSTRYGPNDFPYNEYPGNSSFKDARELDVQYEYGTSPRGTGTRNSYGGIDFGDDHESMRRYREVQEADGCLVKKKVDRYLPMKNGTHLGGPVRLPTGRVKKVGFVDLEPEETRVRLSEGPPEPFSRPQSPIPSLGEEDVSPMRSKTLSQTHPQMGPQNGIQRQHQMGPRSQTQMQPQMRPLNQNQMLPQMGPQNQTQMQHQIGPHSETQTQPQIGPNSQTQIRPPNQVQMQTQIGPHSLTQTQPQMRPLDQAYMQPQIGPHSQTQTQSQMQPLNQTQMQTQIGPHSQTQMQHQIGPHIQTQMQNQIGPHSQTQMQNQIGPYSQTQMQNQIGPHIQTQMQNQIGPYSQTQIRPLNQAQMVTQIGPQSQTQIKPPINDLNYKHPENPANPNLIPRNDNNPRKPISLFGKWMQTHGHLVDPQQFCVWSYASNPDLFIDLSKYQMDLQGNWLGARGQYMTPFFYCYSYDGEPLYLGDCDFYDIFDDGFSHNDASYSNEFLTSPERYFDLSNFEMDTDQRWMDSSGRYIDPINSWYGSSSDEEDVRCLSPGLSDTPDSPDEYFGYLDPYGPYSAGNDFSEGIPGWKGPPHEKKLEDPKN